MCTIRWTDFINHNKVRHPQFLSTANSILSKSGCHPLESFRYMTARELSQPCRCISQSAIELKRHTHKYPHRYSHPQSASTQHTCSSRLWIAAFHHNSLRNNSCPDKHVSNVPSKTTTGFLPKSSEVHRLSIQIRSRHGWQTQWDPRRTRQRVASRLRASRLDR